jgi:3-deoxy-D-manno-octulosonic-acid transferase
VTASTEPSPGAPLIRTQGSRDRGTPDWRAHVAYAAYLMTGAIAGLLALPGLPLLLLTRHGRGMGQRLGWVPRTPDDRSRPLWIHAASVGEVLAAEPLVREVRQHDPTVPILVSTATASGRDAARTHLGVDAVTLLPADILWIPGQALRRVRPRCLAIMETELWPCLLRAAVRHGVPALLVSGRVSGRAARRYRVARWLTRGALRSLAACAMQTPADAARVVALGAEPSTVRVTGNLKWARGATRTGPQGARTIPAFDGRPVLIAASTHAGDEDAILTACMDLWTEFPDLALVLAPRRPERFDAVADALAHRGLRFVRRSRDTGPFGRDMPVLLLDTLGELPDFLPAARGAFVGGTMAPVGGHNVLEPAIFGIPVVFGPHTENVTEAARALLAADAAVCVRTAGELHDHWRDLLTDPAAAAARGARARQVVQARAAVAAQTFAVLRPFLSAQRAA